MGEKNHTDYKNIECFETLVCLEIFIRLPKYKYKGSKL